MSSRVRTESVGDSLCPVCHEKCEIYAIGPCDHPICYRCSTRMRILCNGTECPICRGNLPQVVFLTTKKKYEQVERRNCIPNRKYKILLEDESVEDAYEALLEPFCNVCDRRPRFENFQALQNHMKRTHTMFSCDLCVTHLNIFPYERKFYNRKDLATHRRIGDADNRSYRGHPLCKFCEERYMDNDELFRHLRKSHYYCHFCDAAGTSNEYFSEYPDLKKHFRREHFLCEEDVCGQNGTQFTNAFATEIDLKAHQAAEHTGSRTKAEARDLRSIKLDYNLPPRRRGRDTGIVSPEDYEEVNSSGRGPRDRRHRRNEGRYESYSRSDNQTPPPEVNATPSPVPPALDDFPTLGNGPAPYVPNFAPKSVEAVEDYPSLASQKQSGSSVTPSSSLKSGFAQSAKMSSNSGGLSKRPPSQTNNFASLASVVTSSGPSHPSNGQGRPVTASRPAQTTTSQNSWQTPLVASSEDFPTLGGDKKKKPQQQSKMTKLGPWHAQQRSDSAKSAPSSSKNSTQSSFSAAPSLARSLRDEEHFPTLGGGTTSESGTWLQKKTNPIKNKTNKSSPLGNSKDATSFHKKSDEDDFRLFNGSSETKTDNGKPKKKKKKQKENIPETKTCSGDSGISLSSIASEIDAVVTSEQISSSKDNSEPIVREENPSHNHTATSTSLVESVNERWETVGRKNAPALQEDDFPTLPGKTTTTVTESSATEFKSSNSTHTKPAITTQEDFPALNGDGKKQKTESQKESKRNKKNEGMKKPELLPEEDFPSLQAPPKKTGPPPGFRKPEVAAPPPGLSSIATSIGQAPPGLSSTPAPAHSSSVGRASSSTSIPMSVKLNMYSFAEPVGTKGRNSALVSRVRQLLILKNGGFEQFRALSVEFRSGQLDARTYYMLCQDLFGKEKYLEILPEMIAMLPDILKQHELMEAYRQTVEGRNMPLNLITCPTCHQFLKLEDSSFHLTTHANLARDISAVGFAAGASLAVQT